MRKLWNWIANRVYWTVDVYKAKNFGLITKQSPYSKFYNHVAVKFNWLRPKGCVPFVSSVVVNPAYEEQLNKYALKWFQSQNKGFSKEYINKHSFPFFRFNYSPASNESVPMNKARVYFLKLFIKE